MEPSAIEVVKAAAKIISEFAKAMASTTKSIRTLIKEVRGIREDAAAYRTAKQLRVSIKELRQTYVCAPVTFFESLQGIGLALAYPEIAARELSHIRREDSVEPNSRSLETDNLRVRIGFEFDVDFSSLHAKRRAWKHVQNQISVL